MESRSEMKSRRRKTTSRKTAAKKTAAGKKNRAFTFAGLTARAALGVSAGLLALSYLSVLVNPARAWFMTLFGLLFTPLLIFNVFLAIWALKRRSKAVFIPLIAILPALFFAGSHIRLRSAASPEDISPEAQTLRVVSYNVGRFMQGKTPDRNACLDSVTEFLKKENADIICLQEFRCGDENAVRQLLRRTFKGYDSEYYLFPSRSGCCGNVTLSRFPALGKGVVKFENSANMALYTDYLAGKDTLRVYNCHFESYNISLSGLVKGLAGREKEILKETEHKMKRGISRRPVQVDRVFRHISGSSLPSLVCGDFNDTPMSYTYRRLSRGRSDSFREAGKGFAATYSVLWPLLRLDYILYPERFKAVSHRTPRIGFSDHYPVVADIAL